MDYPVTVVEQLQAQLKSLRKRAKLTQAELGARLGVKQSRVAEIESNPGLVSTEKMLQILRELGVEVVLRDRASAPAALFVPETVVPFDQERLFDALAKAYGLDVMKVAERVRTLIRKRATGTGHTLAERVLRKVDLSPPSHEVSSIAKLLDLQPADLHCELHALKNPGGPTPGLHADRPKGSW